MAKKRKQPEPEEIHVWRHYKRQPCYQWACCVIADPKAPNYYRITDSDPTIADSAFLLRMDAALRSPQEAIGGDNREGDAVVDRIVFLNPGEPGHVDAAIYGLYTENICHAGPEPQR